MKPAWRGVVLNDGSIWAWPTLLMDHAQAFSALPYLEKNQRARWRQWAADEAVDFDLNVSAEDKQLVRKWVARANSSD